MEHLNLIPSHNIEIETSILSSIMLNNSLMDQMEDVEPNDFYSPLHSEIYKIMQSLYRENKPIDMVIIKEKGGERLPIDALMKISQEFAPESLFSYYKKILREKSTKRKIQIIGRELMNNASDCDEPEELLDKAEGEISDIRQKEPRGYGLLKDNLIVAYNQLIERKKNPGSLKGISTGYPDIDIKIGGLQNKKLYYVAARPAMGKTSFALQVCTNIGKKGEPVLIFSLEMGKEELTDRIISQETRISSRDIEMGILSDQDIVKILEKTNTLHNAPIVIEDQSGLTITQIKSIAKRVKKELGGLSLIAIDYLQYISGKGESNRVIVENNSKGLKQLAKDLDVPVLCLSQLSRACELRPDKRPILSDLRDTGGIEQDADVAAFLYRDEYYNPDTELKNIGEFIIRKNRSGSLGTVNLVWLSEITSFTSIEKNRIEPPTQGSQRNKQTKFSSEIKGFKEVKGSDTECPF